MTRDDPAGLPKPEILEVSGAVVIRFRRRTPGKTPGITPGKTPEAILVLLREKPGLSIPELVAQLQKSSSAVERAIRKLRVAGLLERIGPAKGGHWKMIE